MNSRLMLMKIESNTASVCFQCLNPLKRFGCTVQRDCSIKILSKT